MKRCPRCGGIMKDDEFGYCSKCLKEYVEKLDERNK